MKRMILVAICLLSILVFAGGITTNLIVYTNVESPQGTSHYYADKIDLVFSNGLVVACKNEGRYNLYNGLPEKEALKTNAILRAGRIGKLLELVRNRRLSSKTNEVFRGRQP